MESFIFFTVAVSLFLLGMGLGGILENIRIRESNKILTKLHETQEILLPLANKIEHMQVTRDPVGVTLVDYYLEEDPDITQEMPIFEKLQEEKWLSKKHKNLED